MKQPKSVEERVEIAETCSDELNLTMPFLVDGIDDAVGEAWAGWPDRLFVVGTDGKIAYRGAQGPRGFDVAEMEAALRDLLAKDALDKALEGGK